MGIGLLRPREGRILFEYERRGPYVALFTRRASLESKLPTGTVKWFSDQKGFGFVLPDDGGTDLFVHSSNIDSSDRSLQEGQRVEFEVGEGRKGPEATSVRPV